ncbi:EAL domain-containing protein [Aquabacterium sp.]|uniref:EAL domain-containing protein n=1 Tax=Aquabacterium sp. TaxID=1872578 RepID=UPI002C7EDDFC|nr:EAL domain-containing protein [Aquabacterium sp.]HSW06464.1 EAL domain-containing protein [Aquabacterium sp.]
MTQEFHSTPHWASLVDSLNPSMLVVLLSVDGTLMHANSAALEAVGARAGEAVGRPVAQTPWWQPARQGSQPLQRALDAGRRGESSRFLAPVKTLRSGLVDVEFVLCPMFDDSGQVAVLVLSGCEAGERGRGDDTGLAPHAVDPDDDHAVLKAALQDAIRLEQLHLVYQPQVAVDSGDIVGVEALLRWDHPQLGAVSPDRFIPVAERTGLIGMIGDWVLRRACLVARKWQRQGLPAVRMMVNVSSCQLLQDGPGGNLATRIERLLAETGLEPRRLGLELTETMQMQDMAPAVAQLRRLRSLGVEIALDDFGTGSSSLSYLRRLPVDVVKIDRSLVPGVTGSSEALPIVRAIIAMTHQLGMKVVAEGVANEAQLELLAANGCDQFQGFHFSAPVPAEQAEAMLRAGRRVPVPERRRAARAHKVLVVGADAGVLELVGRKLVLHFGDTVIVSTCTDPQEALQRLRVAPFDLLVSDLHMPGMDGVDLLGAARQIQPNAVRMMLLGPSDLARVVEDQRQVDVFRYVSKPWTPKQFFAHFQAAREQVERQRAEGLLRGELAFPGVEASRAVRELLDLEQADPGITTAVRGPHDEMMLPTQLLTMPGDLWSPSSATLMGVGSPARSQSVPAPRRSAHR